MKWKTDGVIEGTTVSADSNARCVCTGNSFPFSTPSFISALSVTGTDNAFPSTHFVGGSSKKMYRAFSKHNPPAPSSILPNFLLFPSSSSSNPLPIPFPLPSAIPSALLRLHLSPRPPFPSPSLPRPSPSPPPSPLPTSVRTTLLLPLTTVFVSSDMINVFARGHVDTQKQERREGEREKGNDMSDGCNRERERQTDIYRIKIRKKRE